MSLCPCNSEKEFDQCCGPYLNDEKPAPTAETLMRSRYTAYALKNFPYVIRTTHTSDRPTEEDFKDDDKIQWKELRILETEAGGPEDEEGTVEFEALYQSGGNLYKLHEKSSFVREEDIWYYLDGEIIQPQPVRSEKMGRNEPCPCGSGKKYKKCCR